MTSTPLFGGLELLQLNGHLGHCEQYLTPFGGLECLGELQACAPPPETTCQCVGTQLFDLEGDPDVLADSLEERRKVEAEISAAWLQYEEGEDYDKSVAEFQNMTGGGGALGGALHDQDALGGALHDQDEPRDQLTCDQPRTSARRLTKSTSLWDPFVVFPEGIKAWQHPVNLQVAAEYVCPCGKNCMKRIGMAPTVVIYKHRQELRELFKQAGTKFSFVKSEIRKHLPQSGTPGQHKLLATFNVGEYNSCCHCAWGVASNIADGPFARARAAAFHEAQLHSAGYDLPVKPDRDYTYLTHVRRQLDSYVELLRSQSEGAKSVATGWFMPRESADARWDTYKEWCLLKEQPALGTAQLLASVIKLRSVCPASIHTDL